MKEKIDSSHRRVPISKRMEKLKKSGLIGCLNNSGVTSSNYKDHILKKRISYDSSHLML